MKGPTRRKTSALVEQKEECIFDKGFSHLT